MRKLQQINFGYFRCCGSCGSNLLCCGSNDKFVIYSTYGDGVFHVEAFQVSFVVLILIFRFRTTPEFQEVLDAIASKKKKNYRIDSNL